MKRLTILTFIAILLLSVQSCKIMYTPNMQNVPLMKEKNEVRATVGLSDAQAAYAVTKNVGVMVNAQYKKPTWTVTSGTREYKYQSKKNLVEAGAGYMKQLGEEGNFVFEAYGGGGIGKLTYNRSYTDTTTGATTNTDYYSTQTSRFFIQPSIGISNDFVDFAFSTRFVGLKFGKIDTAGYTQQDLLNEELGSLNKTMYTFLEPALTLRVGSKYVKFHVQAIYSMKLNSAPLNYLPFAVNFGVHLNIAPRFKSQ